MHKTLLVPLDGSALAERALPYAVHLAREAGARLILLHAAPELGTPSPETENRSLAEALEPHVAALREAGIAVEAVTVAGSAVAAILAAVRDHHVDLVVMATHGRTGLGRWLFGSVADDVLRSTEIPVMVVTPTSERRWQPGQPLRLLVPLDGSLHSEKALGPASEIAHPSHAELWLVRAIEEPSVASYRYTGDGEPIPGTAGEHELAEARQYLETLAARRAPSFVTIDILADIGPAADVIVNAARHAEADLIVMATHGRAGLERLTMGSVATQVLQRTPAPVVLVGPGTPMGGPDDASDTPPRL